MIGNNLEEAKNGIQFLFVKSGKPFWKAFRPFSVQIFMEIKYSSAVLGQVQCDFPLILFRAAFLDEGEPHQPFDLQRHRRQAVVCRHRNIAQLAFWIFPNIINDVCLIYPQLLGCAVAAHIFSIFIHCLIVFRHFGKDPTDPFFFRARDIFRPHLPAFLSPASGRAIDSFLPMFIPVYNDTNIGLLYQVLFRSKNIHLWLISKNRGHNMGILYKIFLISTLYIDKLHRLYYFILK